MKSQRVLGAALSAALALTLAACSGSPAPSAGGAGTPSEPTRSSELTVVVHDSFNLDAKLLDEFKQQTGYRVTIAKSGDAGAMTNKLVLTKGSPLGDVVYGIDNTFAGRAVDEGVLTPYASSALPAGSRDLAADDRDLLTPIDFGDVCVNADKRWYASHKLAVPASLDDLAKPEYKDQLAVENPASSSPGLAFLAATVAAKGEDGYLDYWGKLKDNGVKVAKDWDTAYSVEFSGSSGKGSRPLVVSYATSPAFEVPKSGGEPPTTALLDTCFRQVEYAGVIAGAKNEVGARKFIDFLLSPKVQADIPDQMYMYPAVKATTLPSDWTRYAPLSDKPWTVPAADLSSKREGWISDWTAKVIG
ncbi:thiamine ABC transporter substrate-binding protein [Nigerium massiliense]|uniref:thiamine ABC transporter substrate-binding protein n=1 Tax=Nigerium massiliense TaxID=1522317 RepID=UPI000590687A|nr:thiamine ABC transporter substrate-binding protein [Nigerium massiliense]